MVTPLLWRSRIVPFRSEDSCLVSCSRAIPSGECGISYRLTYADLISDMSALRAPISESVVNPSLSRLSSGLPLA